MKVLILALALMVPLASTASSQSNEARFEIKQTADGQFMFNLIAAGPRQEIIATSERYTTKQAAKKGIEAVKRYAADALIVDNTK